MASLDTSGLTKKVAIDKANLQVLVTVSVASVITIFCIVGSLSLKNTSSFRSRAIKAEKTSEQQLSTNLTAYSALTSSYHDFLNKPDIIDGTPSSTNPKDPNNNSVIVLNALPDKDDFPGLASTLDKILATNGFDVTSLSGAETTTAVTTATTPGASVSPQPIDFNFTVSNTNYQGISTMLNLLEKSIRPMYIDTINITGSGGSIIVVVTGHTFYQPDTSLNITKETIK
jgi:type II secretory pathway pseudopilin PulG